MKTNKEKEQRARRRFLLALSGGYGLFNAVYAFNIIRVWPVYAEDSIETLCAGIVITAGFGMLMLPAIAVWLDRLIHSTPIVFKIVLFLPYGLILSVFCGLSGALIYLGAPLATYWLGTVLIGTLAGILIVLGFYIHWHGTIFSLTKQEPEK